MKPVLVLRHEAHIPLGSLHDILAAERVPFEYVDLFRGTPARLPLDEASGLVILGGTMNVDQVGVHPFLAAELDWIREAVERHVPLLGLCLGAQLLAKAFGARVYRSPRREIGWYEVTLLPWALEDPLMHGLRRVQTVFEWHGDTFDLPDGAAHLAVASGCRHQAIRVGPRAWGLQFHAEMTEPLLREWLSDPGFEGELAELSYINPQAIRREAATRLPAMEAFCHTLLRRFAGLCRS